MTHAVVVLDDQMSLERALVSLKKQLLTRGVFRDMRTHGFYLKPGERKRKKSKTARKKRRAAILKAERADAQHGERLAWQKTNPPERRR